MIRTTCFLILSAAGIALAASTDRAANLIILDESAVKNLQIATQVVEESTFEETIFALGEVRVAPGKKSAISSRIPGRALDVMVHPNEFIEAGAPAVIVESRQPGDPPPQVTLHAPISGIVTVSQIHPGEPVETNEVLAEIIDLTVVEAVARVPDSAAAKLHPGQRTRVVIPAVSDQPVDAELLRFGVTADPDRGTVDAIFLLQNPEMKIRPGMRAEFSIVVSRSDGVFVVPRDAVQGDAVNRYVFVTDFELPNAFIKTPVVVGRSNEKHSEIVSGLLPADEVVSRGAYALSFAGSSNTMSLKEALDAAHGHEHAADGSELPTNSAATQPTAPAGETTEAHAAPASPFWMFTSAILLILLVISTLRKPARPHA